MWPRVIAQAVPTRRESALVATGFLYPGPSALELLVLGLCAMGTSQRAS
jgi:hypothetical protein